MSQQIPVKQDTPALKVFKLDDIKRVIEVSIHWPALYPGYEPWVFKLRLALSKDIEEKRQEWMGLTEAEANKPGKLESIALDQICDLLTEHPSGFGDLGNPAELVSLNPGSTFRSYVAKASENPEQKETLNRIVVAAYNGYWGRALPQSFRPAV
jgi:hypothetical protein